MKLKNYMAAGSLLALMALAGSCSSEEIMENGTGTEVPAAETQQLVMNFGGLKLANAPGTRAETIATQEETEVNQLIVVLAGVNDEKETTLSKIKVAAVVYEYRSDWGDAEPDWSTSGNYKKLELTQNGNVLTGRMRLLETITDPEIKTRRALVLVNGVGVHATYNDGSKRDRVTGADFAAEKTENLYMGCGGMIGGQTLEEQGGTMTFFWGPDNLQEENIECPLPMTGMVDQINLHGVTNVNVQLKRLVSRFDLRNGQKDQLRVKSIQPLDATTGVEFDDTKQERVDMMEQSFVENAGGSIPIEVVKPEVAPAFYTFPSALVEGNQPMKFRIKAEKLVDVEAGKWEEKTYTLNLENADKQPVSIDANTRYVINIAEVTDLNVTARITVADWEKAEDIDGDLNPSDKSRKEPEMKDMKDDDVNGITWTLNEVNESTKVPTALHFSRAEAEQAISFSAAPATPVVEGQKTDQPRIAIDLFREDGLADDIWLTVSSAVAPATRAAEGDTIYTLKVNETLGEYPTLIMKVKNYYFPEKFVMVRVTAQAASAVPVTPNAKVPDGWTDNDANNFDEGTVEDTTPPAE